MAERRRQRRALLAGYYELNEEKATPNSDDSPIVSNDCCNIDSASFDTAKYLDSLLVEQPIKELIATNKRLTNEVEDLDQQMQSLVYENYSKIISASETMNDILTSMGNLEDTLKSLDHHLDKMSSSHSSVSAALEPGRTEIAKLSRTHDLVQKLDFIFELPSRISALIKEGIYEMAISNWVRTRSALEKHNHLPSFVAIHSECADIMNNLAEQLLSEMKKPQTSSFDRQTNARLLIDLGYDMDGIKIAFLTSGIDSVMATVSKCKESLASSIQEYELEQSEESENLCEDSEDCWPHGKLCASVLDLVDTLGSDAAKTLADVSHDYLRVFHNGNPKSGLDDDVFNDSCGVTLDRIVEAVTTSPRLVVAALSTKTATSSRGPSASAEPNAVVDCVRRFNHCGGQAAVERMECVQGTRRVSSFYLKESLSLIELLGSRLDGDLRADMDQCFTSISEPVMVEAPLSSATDYFDHITRVAELVEKSCTQGIRLINRRCEGMLSCVRVLFQSGTSIIDRNPSQVGRKAVQRIEKSIKRTLQQVMQWSNSAAVSLHCHNETINLQPSTSYFLSPLPPPNGTIPIVSPNAVLLAAAGISEHLSSAGVTELAHFTQKMGVEGLSANWDLISTAANDLSMSLCEAYTQEQLNIIEPMADEWITSISLKPFDENEPNCIDLDAAEFSQQALKLALHLSGVNAIASACLPMVQQDLANAGRFANQLNSMFKQAAIPAPHPEVHQLTGAVVTRVLKSCTETVRNERLTWGSANQLIVDTALLKAMLSHIVGWRFHTIHVFDRSLVESFISTLSSSIIFRAGDLYHQPSLGAVDGRVQELMENAGIQF